MAYKEQPQRNSRHKILKTRPSNNRTLNTKKGNPKCIFQNLSIKNHRVNPSSPLHPCSDCQVNSERIVIAISLPKSQNSSHLFLQIFGDPKFSSVSAAHTICTEIPIRTNGTNIISHCLPTYFTKLHLFFFCEWGPVVFLLA